MNIKQLYEKYKLEDYFYHHLKENYTHEGFTFLKGEYYKTISNEGGDWLYDDNGNIHDMYEMDFDKIGQFGQNMNE